jgi:lysophospholipase L1-like esterase
MGDSIMDYFANGQGASVWNADFAPLPADDFAIRGNLAENVLYQIDQGELTGFTPRVLVLMVGINDLTTGETPDQTAAAIEACVAALQAQLPSTGILLLGILPAHQSPSDPVRAEITQTNTLISGLNNGLSLRYLDIGQDFLQPDGTISTSILSDYVHPTTLGYSILANAILPTLQAMLLPAPTPVANSSSSVGAFDPTSGVWYLGNQSSPQAGAQAHYGLPGWQPIAGDWSGSGSAGLGMIDPTTATFYLRNEASGGPADAGVFQYGAPGWEAVAGDWNVDGSDSIGAVNNTGQVALGGVVYPTTWAWWYLRNENSGGSADATGGVPFTFGLASWIPLVGDWTGTGHAGIGAYDPSTATFYLKNTIGPGPPDLTIPLGMAGWQAVAGNWGNEKTTAVAVIDPQNTWYVINPSNPGTFLTAPFAYGLAGWVPLLKDWGFTPAGSSPPAAALATLLLPVNTVTQEMKSSSAPVPAAVVEQPAAQEQALASDPLGLLPGTIPALEEPSAPGR